MIKNVRRSTGAMLVTILGFMISVGILLTLGVITFEAIRAYTARDELRAATEAASLAAAATLASSDSTDSRSSHLAAIIAAHEAFNSNTIVGQSLSTALTAPNEYHVPPREESSLYIAFLDPNNNNQQTSAPSYTNGTNVKCVGAYSLAPAFNVVNFAFPIRAESLGRTPELDIVVVFDVSSSMDDQTRVTFVRRVWDTNAQPTRPGSGNGAIVHQICAAPAGSWQASNVSPRAAGKYIDITTPPKVGGINVCPPQNLRGIANNRTPLTWDPTSIQLRNGGAAADAGAPPGNFPSGAVTWINTTFTDEVVNIDDKDDFAGFTYNGFDFPDLATLVEAARGNLENQGVFMASKASTCVPATIAPRPGYQAAYIAAARRVVQPLNNSKVAALRFFTIMKNNTDARFGFVSFGSVAHTVLTDTTSGPNVSSDYPPGGNGQWPIPGIALNSSNSNYDEICNPTTGALTLTIANGGTNIGDGLDKAVDMLTGSQTRPNAKRAIVLFTDGMRSTGPLPSVSAQRAKDANKGIAIYTIGLAQNREIIPDEVDLLNDGAGTTYDYVDPQTGSAAQYTATVDGIAKIAGNGGKFFLVTNSRNLNYVFENIARSFVQLMQQ